MARLICVSMTINLIVDSTPCWLQRPQAEGDCWRRGRVATSVWGGWWVPWVQWYILRQLHPGPFLGWSWWCPPFPTGQHAPPCLWGMRRMYTCIERWDIREWVRKSQNAFEDNTSSEAVKVSVAVYTNSASIMTTAYSRKMTQPIGGNF